MPSRLVHGSSQHRAPHVGARHGGDEQYGAEQHRTEHDDGTRHGDVRPGEAGRADARHADVRRANARHGDARRRTPRRRRSLALVTATAAAVLAAGGPQARAAGGPSGSATTPSPAVCSGIIRIDGLAFTPSQIPAGQQSTATLKATNCTGVTQSVSETWAGSWVSSSVVGIPPGCAAIDPLLRSASFAPYGSNATSTGYLVFSGCTADGLKVTVTVSQGGTILGQATATLKIDHPATTG